jgi:hypothetical protein
MQPFCDYLILLDIILLKSIQVTIQSNSFSLSCWVVSFGMNVPVCITIHLLKDFGVSSF